MRINWETSVDELYHGHNITYIDLDADEICHYKYIKRELLSNGKYRYFYDQSNVDSYKNAAAKAQADYRKANLKVANARVNVHNAKVEYDRAEGNRKNARAMKESERELQNAEKQRTTARKAAGEAERRYRKKKITTFPARTIAKGAVKVANLFSGANKKTIKSSKKTTKTVKK